MSTKHFTPLQSSQPSSTSEHPAHTPLIGGVQCTSARGKLSTLQNRSEPKHGTMKPASRQRKGKAGEIEAAQILSKLLGVEVKREAAAYLPGFSAPDITRTGGIHWEVKRRQLTALPEWLRQATKDAGGRVPVVVHRPNRAEWMATVKLNDLPRFCREIAGVIQGGAR